MVWLIIARPTPRAVQAGERVDVTAQGVLSALRWTYMGYSPASVGRRMRIVNASSPSRMVVAPVVLMQGTLTGSTVL